MKKTEKIQFKKKSFGEIVRLLAEPALLSIIAAATIGITWGLPQIFSNSNFHYPMIGLDGQIPLITWFVYFYYITFPLGIFTIFLTSFKDRKVCYDIVITFVICAFVSTFFYYFYQTEMIKPDLIANSFTDRFVIATWHASNPTNCFPSQHCFMALACIIAAVSCKNMKGWWRATTIFLGVMIILSTMFIKQHYFLDFIASLIIIAIAYAVVRLLKLGEKTANKVEQLKDKNNK